MAARPYAKAIIEAHARRLIGAPAPGTIESVAAAVQRRRDNEAEAARIVSRLVRETRPEVLRLLPACIQRHVDGDAR
jgi:hypothetical protein